MDHDSKCERELTSHGYTPCRCDLRAGICYCRKNPCECHAAMWNEEEIAVVIIALERAHAQRNQLLKLAREATNGWACSARHAREHSEIARLHTAIDAVVESGMAFDAVDPHAADTGNPSTREGESSSPAPLPKEPTTP